jgi:hypothetical protein
VLEKEGDQYYLYAGDDVEPLLASGGGMFGGANEAAVLPVPLVAGEWRHLAVTYDGAMIRMYVDGRPTSELTRWYGGRIDGVWVADSLLTQGPIRAPWVRAALARKVSLRVVGVAGPTTPAHAPVIDVRTRRGKHAVLLSVVGEDLVLSRSSVGTELGWHAPEIRFRGALRAVRSGEPLEIRLQGDQRFPIVGVNGRSTAARGVTLGNGWRVVLRSELLPRPIGVLLDLVWIGGLTYFATFWAKGVGRWSAVTLALGAMLALLSVWASLAPVSAMEWSAFVAGTVASRLAPRVMREGQVESVSPI